MQHKVWFVGSNPSIKNTDPNVPFHGTKSVLNLMAWIAVLDVENYEMINVSNVVGPYDSVRPTADDYERLKTALKGQERIVALGGVAAYHLTHLGITHFVLPHPSPRNRLLNDPIFIEEKLTECREYLWRAYEFRRKWTDRNRR